MPREEKIACLGHDEAMGRSALNRSRRQVQ